MTQEDEKIVRDALAVTINYSESQYAIGFAKNALAALDRMTTGVDLEALKKDMFIDLHNVLDPSGNIGRGYMKDWIDQVIDHLASTGRLAVQGVKDE